MLRLLALVLALSSSTALAQAEGKVAMECGMTTVTLTRQKEVDFSSLIFADGGNMLLRDDAALRQAAELGGKKIAVQGGTTTEQVLRRSLKTLRVDAEIVLVKSPAEGLALVEDGKAAAYAGDRIALLVLAKRARDPAKLMVLEQDYSYEPYAITLPRGDAGLRLAVNRELARLFRTVEQSDWKQYAAPAAAAVAGGVIGHQFVGGTGKTLLTIAGAVGGGVVGHKVESQSRDKIYEVIVKMDDGSHRTITYQSTPPIRQGDRVRLRDGQLVVVES